MICSSCYIKFLAVEENELFQHDSSKENIIESDTEEETLEGSCEEIEKQNRSVCFSMADVLPIKLHNQSVSGKKTLSKQKHESNFIFHSSKISKMQKDQSRDDAEKAASYDRLLNLLKEKIDKAITRSKKIKLLTIALD